MTGLEVISCGPSLAVQDQGRPGFHAKGLTRGGAADQIALAEGAALLGQPDSLAAVEMIGMGGHFRATSDVAIALTGAPMRTTCNGEALLWNCSHLLPAGSDLVIGGAERGIYGYLHLGGGVDTPQVMGARATHVPAGLGTVIEPGLHLPAGESTAIRTGQTFAPGPRLDGGTLRFVSSMQTDRFTADTLRRFQQTAFSRDPRGNRQGVRMAHQGDGFFAEGQLNIVSEVIVPGDIQIAGDGAPYVLGPDCQTTGGYPRIGSVLPCDLPLVMQAQPGSSFRFEMVDLETAVALERAARQDMARLPDAITPLVRDPAQIANLLSHQLISGAVSASANPFEDPLP